MDGITPARRLKLLFVAPFPPDLSGSHGGSRAIASMIDALARRHDVSVLCLGDADGAAVRRAPAHCGRQIRVDAPIRRGPDGHFWSRVAEFVRLLFGAPPDWVRESWSPEMAGACAELAGEIQPDMVHFEFHVMAQYIPAVRAAAPKARCIVTEHEPGVASAGARLEGEGVRRRVTSWIRRRAWARYERRTLSQADAVVTFTRKDETVVREMVRGTSPRVACIPLRILPETNASESPIESDLLFVGAFRHPPNADAAMRLATTIYPRIRVERPETRMVIVGPDPPPQLVQAAGQGIEITGEVDDLAPYFAGASIFICPLRLGGGMRVKILEACAAGKAVIATPQSVEGLSLRPGIEFTSAATDDEFVERAIDLLSDPARREQLEQAALDWASRTQDPDEWAAQYDSLYAELARATE